MDGDKKMKKKILTGSILAVFLLVSIAFVSPVQANANRKMDAVDIYDQYNIDLQLLIDEFTSETLQFQSVAEENQEEVNEELELGQVSGFFYGDVWLVIPEFLYDYFPDYAPSELPDWLYAIVSFILTIIFNIAMYVLFIYSIPFLLIGYVVAEILYELTGITMVDVIDTFVGWITQILDHLGFEIDYYTV